MVSAPDLESPEGNSRSLSPLSARAVSSLLSVIPVRDCGELTWRPGRVDVPTLIVSHNISVLIDGFATEGS